VLATVGSEIGADGLDEGTIHDVLRNDRRRLVIESLLDNGGTADVSGLAERIAARESGSDPPPKNKRQSVYVSLHQTHLPKLDDLDIVAYDPDDRVVELLDRVEEVEIYMEVVPDYGLSWGEFYFGLGVLGLLTTIGVRIGVPVLSAVDPSLVAGVFFAGLVIASAYHVYTQQDRIVFQRVLEWF
jgi:hypothetical protein